MELDELEESLARGQARRRRAVQMAGVLVVLFVLAAFYWAYRKRHPPPRPSVTLSAEQWQELERVAEASQSTRRDSRRALARAISGVDPSAFSPDAPACTHLDYLAAQLRRNPQRWGGWDLGALPFERSRVMSVSRTPDPFDLLPARSASRVRAWSTRPGPDSTRICSSI